MAKIKKISPLSLAKLTGTMYGAVGLLVGALMAVAAWFGTDLSRGQLPEGFRQMAIVIMPVFYGIGGFIAGGVTGWLYNIVVKWVGPIEVEIES